VAAKRNGHCRLGSTVGGITSNKILAESLSNIMLVWTKKAILYLLQSFRRKMFMGEEKVDFSIVDGIKKSLS
jgi:hypothetical protein